MEHTTDIQASDPRAFHEFERDAWEGLPETYADSFGMLTRQAVAPLLDAVADGPGPRLLETACGPGNVAGAAAASGAEATGIDFTAGMIAVAKRLHAGIGFLQANAEALPFADQSFDRVVCSFGMHHFPRAGNAVAEAHRVLAPGGRFAFTIWCPPNEAEPTSLRALIQRAIKAHGDAGVQVPAGPPEAEIADRERCRSWLASRGFAEFAQVQLDIEGKWRNSDEVLFTLFNGMGRTKAIIEAQGAAARARIKEAIRDAARACERAGVIRIPVPAILVSATRT